MQQALLHRQVSFKWSCTYILEIIPCTFTAFTAFKFQTVYSAERNGDAPSAQTKLTAIFIVCAERNLNNNLQLAQIKRLVGINTMKALEVFGGMARTILNFATKMRSASWPGHFTSGKTEAGTRSIKRWIRPTARLDVLVKRKKKPVFPAGNRTRFFR